jgi:hypothetical protein
MFFAVLTGTRPWILKEPLESSKLPHLIKVHFNFTVCRSTWTLTCWFLWWGVVSPLLGTCLGTTPRRLSVTACWTDPQSCLQPEEEPCRGDKGQVNDMVTVCKRVFLIDPGPTCVTLPFQKTSLLSLCNRNREDIASKYSCFSSFTVFGWIFWDSIIHHVKWIPCHHGMTRPCAWNRRLPHMENSSEYVEQAVANSPQGVVLRLDGREGTRIPNRK